jgi:hypothetical protein
MLPPFASKASFRVGIFKGAAVSRHSAHDYSFAVAGLASDGPSFVLY